MATLLRGMRYQMIPIPYSELCMTMFHVHILTQPVIFYAQLQVEVMISVKSKNYQGHTAMKVAVSEKIIRLLKDASANVSKDEKDKCVIEEETCETDSDSSIGSSDGGNNNVEKRRGKLKNELRVLTKRAKELKCMLQAMKKR